MASPTKSGPRFIVGIDLGTTNTVVAYADTHHGGDAPAVTLLPLDQLVAPGEVAARSMLPSVRYHGAPGELPAADLALPWRADADDTVVGAYAQRLGAAVPTRLVTSAKSWLSNAAVDRSAAILPWGAPADVVKVSPVAASASYLAHVRGAWAHRFPEHPLADQDIVLTIPASFDEAARALTLQAAADAGLPKVRLVEEPQAAFYDWLDRERAKGTDDWTSSLANVRLAVVVDVGGGTTDLSLIRVELRDTGPRFTRIAVGNHLMLGGDNMDLLLARRAEATLATGGGQLGAARFAELLLQCRTAKETLLAADAPEHATLTLLGGGSKLIGGTRTSQVARKEVQDLLVDGFFPEVSLDARPERRAGGLVEFGLPYVSDAAVTKHLAAFLANHAELSREALGDRAPSSGTPVPDAVLLNGGVWNGARLRERLLSVLGAWRGAPLTELANPAPDHAVAQGAVAYGLARRGVGLRIGGGSARSYFLVLPKDPTTPDAPAQGLCVLPRGAEEGEEIALSDRTFSLRVGAPMRVNLVSSTSEVAHQRPGDVVALDDARYQALPPIAAVLDAKDAAPGATEIPVRLATTLTEIGTLEVSCIAADNAQRRWKLEWALRSFAAAANATSNATVIEHIRELHPRFAEATDKVRVVYGKSSVDAGPKDVKTLRADLEKVLGARENWETPVLRELFAALWAGQKHRRRSADHERVWCNLVGYALRPGFGYPLDDYRVGELISILPGGVQFAPEAQNWAEWWILFRRIAGGLPEATQITLLTDLEWYLEPPTPRPKPRPAGPKKLGYEDMVRLAGSLEHPSPAQKARVGSWLVTRLQKHDENPQSWWAVGRLGARVPFYGSAHRVVPQDTAAAWLEACLARPWKKDGDPAAFAATLLARLSGDRARDLSDALRAQVADRLAQIDAPAAWRTMVTTVTELDAADERRVFGESLPPGLRLL